MLKLSSDISSEATSGGIRGKAVVAVETFLIRSPVVVDDRLPEMIAVVQWRAAYVRESRIERFPLGVGLMTRSKSIAISAKLRLQRSIEFISYSRCRTIISNNLAGLFY